MSCLRLAHFSDPHLPLPALPHLREVRFKRILSLLSWGLNRRRLHKWAPLCAVMRDIHSTHPDLVALTGDLTNLGLLSEFLQARRWLQDQNLPPTLLVPGNHEAVVRESSAVKEEIWAPWLHQDTSQSHPPLLVDKGVALIGLNTAVPSLPFFATGRTGLLQLSRLADCLETTKAAGLCRVVLLHHPPLRHMVQDRKALTDLEALQDVLRNTGAELVLHGHSHRATTTTIPGTDIPVIGTTSASHIPDSPEKAAGWNCIDIEAQTKSWKITVQRRALAANGQMQAHESPHIFTRLRPEASEA